MLCQALAHAYERWDGNGYPDGWEGDEVPIAVRVVAAARDAELFGRTAAGPGDGDALAGQAARATTLRS